MVTRPSPLVLSKIHSGFEVSLGQIGKDLAGSVVKVHLLQRSANRLPRAGQIQSFHDDGDVDDWLLGGNVGNGSSRTVVQLAIRSFLGDFGGTSKHTLDGTPRSAEDAHDFSN